MAGRMDFEFDLGRGGGRRKDETAPMRLVVLGDFSGKPTAGRPPLAERSIYRVDIDTLDKTIKRLEPRIDVAGVELRFEQLEDFHPDRLYARVDGFERLRQMRASPPVVETGEDLDRLLGKRVETAAAATNKPASGLDALIQNIVAPHVVKETPEATRQHQAITDQAIVGEMRALLHDAAFQSLESSWRGVSWLVSNLEFDNQLQLHLVDVTRDEIAADVKAVNGQVTQTGLYKTLVERGTAGDKSWSVVVASSSFGTTAEDVATLAALAMIASRAGGPLLAGADRSLVEGHADQTAAWQALRRHEVARWIGLVGPRVLLRLPYGKRTDPIESFQFEEFAGDPVHEEFLWGHGSLAAALSLGHAFLAKGWDMVPGDEPELDDLPAYTFVRDDEPALQACAERYLTESQMNALLAAGLIPLVSRRDRAAIVAVRFQSIADPPAPLAW